MKRTDARERAADVLLALLIAVDVALVIAVGRFLHALIPFLIDFIQRL